MGKWKEATAQWSSEPLGRRRCFTRGILEPFHSVRFYGVVVVRWFISPLLVVVVVVVVVFVALVVAVVCLGVGWGWARPVSSSGGWGNFYFISRSVFVSPPSGCHRNRRPATFRCVFVILFVPVCSEDFVRRTVGSRWCIADSSAEILISL